MIKTCLIDGCDKPVYANGVCRAHYDGVAYRKKKGRLSIEHKLTDNTLVLYYKHIKYVFDRTDKQTWFEFSDIDRLDLVVNISYNSDYGFPIVSIYAIDSEATYRKTLIMVSPMMRSGRKT